MTKPFRWTKQCKLIREALTAGIGKAEIMKITEDSIRDDGNWRPSEVAMTLGALSSDIDAVQERL